MRGTTLGERWATATAAVGEHLDGQSIYEEHRLSFESLQENVPLRGNSAVSPGLQGIRERAEGLDGHVEGDDELFGPSPRNVICGGCCRRHAAPGLERVRRRAQTARPNSSCGPKAVEGTDFASSSPPQRRWITSSARSALPCPRLPSLGRSSPCRPSGATALVLTTSRPPSSSTADEDLPVLNISHENESTAHHESVGASRNDSSGCALSCNPRWQGPGIR